MMRIAGAPVNREKGATKKGAGLATHPPVQSGIGPDQNDLRTEIAHSRGRPTLL